MVRFGTEFDFFDMNGKFKLNHKEILDSKIYKTEKFRKAKQIHDIP